MDETRRARVLAFYLPQFHPIPENDRTWGPGFTEWTNVAAARPRFRGHYQPRLPADLGFYDLRLPETREAQAALARAAGVEGFCYWHYWLGGGRRILERPFDEVLASGQPDFPFCLAWANHSWTGVWAGNPKTVLIEQTYPGPDDERAHFEAVLPAFRDPRHVRVDGKPLFIVHDPRHLPDPPGFIAHWRRLAREAGLPGLFLLATTAPGDFADPLFADFDAYAPSQPNGFLQRRKSSLGVTLVRLLRERHLGDHINRTFGERVQRFRAPRRFDYRDLMADLLNDLRDDPRFMPTVMPNWDNTPRSGYRGFALYDESPALFRQLLARTIAWLAPRPLEHRLVILKAWNEWAEGNHVEPDRRFGHGYLDALRAEILPPRAGQGPAGQDGAAHDERIPA